MTLQVSDYILWMVPAVLQLAIAGGMLRRGLHREFPFFFSYTVFQLLRAGALLLLVHQSYAVYFYVRWTAEIITVSLGFGVIYEILRHVLRPYEALWKTGQALIACAGVLLVLFAVGTAVGASTAPEHSPLIAGIMVVGRSLRFVQCGLLVGLLLFFSYFAIAWRHYAFGIALGLGVFSSVELAATAARSEVGWIGNQTYSLVTRVAYTFAVMIWTAYLLRPEPVRLPAERVPQHPVEEWNRALQELWQR